MHLVGGAAVELEVARQRERVGAAWLSGLPTSPASGQAAAAAKRRPCGPAGGDGAEVGVVLGGAGQDDRRSLAPVRLTGSPSGLDPEQGDRGRRHHLGGGDQVVDHHILVRLVGELEDPGP